MSKKILIVEDDASIRLPLEEYLNRNQYQTIAVDLLSLAEEKLKDHFDCIILDWNLPDGEGIDLAKKLKANPQSPPVLMLTARADLVDKVIGLEVGAQDYLTKPYEPRELLARVKNLISFNEKKDLKVNSQSLSLHGIIIDKIQRIVQYDKKEITLTKMEFDLLYLLLSNPGKVYSRDELLDNIWGYDHFPSTRTVDAHVVQLRDKFFPELLETVRGVGYRCKK